MISDAIPIKIVVVGDSQVGKTSLILSYINQKVGRLTGSKLKFDYQIIEDEKYRVALWDSIGQQYQQDIPKLIVKDADGIILCFDLNKQFNFQSIYSQMESLVGQCQSNCQFVLIGTKSDLPKYNSDMELQSFYDRLKDKFESLNELQFASIFQGESIKNVFQQIIELSALSKLKRGSQINFENFLFQSEINQLRSQLSVNSFIKTKENPKLFNSEPPQQQQQQMSKISLKSKDKQKQKQKECC